MFSINDFSNLMKFFKGDNVPELDANLVTLANDTKARTTNLFTDNIDLECFASDDYKRLRKFLISWYSSLKTLGSVMQNVSDIRSLPDSHLNQLFNSFGFVDSLDEITHLNKIDLFYDLVNLYKIKGTPESVARILSYFGVPNVDIVEYWLQYNHEGSLVLRPQTVLSLVPDTIIKSKDINLDYVSNLDPHWFLTTNQINTLFLNNRIAFPSKTPYFGIRPFIQSSGNIITPTLEILSRLVREQYKTYSSGTNLEKDINIPILNVKASLLDLYLGAIYSFKKLYNITDSSGLSILNYNDDMLDYPLIYSTYDNITNRKNAKTRSQVKSNYEEFCNYYTSPRSQDFISSSNTPEEILTITNPELKDIINRYYETGDGLYTLKSLLKCLTSWTEENINHAVPDLLALMLGFSELDYITDVVNFFKPHRARLIFVENVYLLKSPSLDSVITEDSFDEVPPGSDGTWPYGVTLNETIVDYDVADSKPSYPESEEYSKASTPIKSVPQTFNSKRIINVYVDSLGVVKCDYITPVVNPGVENIVFSTPPIGCYRIYSMNIERTSSGINRLHVNYDNISDTVGNRSTEILSYAEPSLDRIVEVGMDISNYFEILYNNVVPSTLDPLTRLYFSRSLYDCDSYFDIGASTDIPQEVKIDITHHENDIFNHHKGNSESFYYSPNENEIVVCGGFDGFDSSLVFDLPMTLDVCHIISIDAIPPSVPV